MMRRSWWVALFAFGLLAACQTVGGSTRGESCRARSDCVGGLSCIAQRCTDTDFMVTTSTRECDLVACMIDMDCCDPFPSTCPSLQTMCMAGVTTACTDYDTLCVCHFMCTATRQCVFRCDDTADCVARGGVCQGGTCVECATDAECMPDVETCNTTTGQCEPRCASNPDCPYFHTCQGGRCVESGCMHDHECIAFYDNPLAICNETAGPMGFRECTIPCTVDTDCFVGGQYNFFECQDGACHYVGCETDEECRIALNIVPGSGESAVCQ